MIGNIEVDIHTLYICATRIERKIMAHIKAALFDLLSMMICVCLKCECWIVMNNGGVYRFGCLRAPRS